LSTTFLRPWPRWLVKSIVANQRTAFFIFSQSEDSFLIFIHS
jgi:hypothetical protein